MELYYAIETLEIELAKCVEARRTIDRYSVYPEYSGCPIDYKKRIYYLKEAIKILKTQKS